MEIKGLGNNLPFSQPVQKKTDVQTGHEAKDRIEISSKAREMAQTEKTPEKLEEIRMRVKSKFYESDEVLNKVADAILKEINK